MPPDIFTKMFADREKWKTARHLINVVLPEELEVILQLNKDIFQGILEKLALAVVRKPVSSNAKPREGSPKRGEVSAEPSEGSPKLGEVSCDVRSSPDGGPRQNHRQCHHLQKRILPIRSMVLLPLLPSRKLSKPRCWTIAR